MVIGACERRHRSVAFRAFLDRVERAVPPGLEVHLVLDNLKTHKAGPIHDGLVKRPLSTCTSRPPAPPAGVS